MQKSLCLLLLLVFISSVNCDIPSGQKTALTNLYNNCGGSGWVNKWTVSSEVCPSSGLPWFGVVCSGTTTAIELNLGYNNVVGSSTACCNAINGLNALTSLRYMFLSNNQITCPFPSWPSLTSLQTIQIQNNMFSSSIPSSISNLAVLTSLIAFNNRITGPLPTFPSSLQKLYLTKNNIATAIPTTIGNLNALTAMFMANNSIPGPLPTTFSTLGTILFVDLSFNVIDGSLIPMWSPAGSTRPNVDLRGNMLDCRLPTTLATISHVLDLTGNKRNFLCPLPAISATVTGISTCVEMRITSVTPSKVSTVGGTTVTLQGTNFDQCQGRLVVRIGSTSVPFTLISSTQVTFTAPALPFGDKSLQIYFNDNVTPASSNFLGIRYIVPCAAQCDPLLDPNIAGCDETSGICLCANGWGGALCTTVYFPCPSNCNGFGSCNTATGVCTCNVGRTGFDCSQPDLDCPLNCSPPYGQCDRLTGRCSCTSPWSLPDCATQPCPLNCNGHGTCNDQTGVCTCDTNWSGAGCSTADISCPGDCYGHGTCNRATGTCGCNPPYTVTSNCQYISCPNGCSGHGTCDGLTGTCTCSPGWAVPDCKTPYIPCGGTPMCTGNGECNYLTGTCVCLQNWSPLTNCSTAPCPGDCSGNGVCNYNTRVCTCDEGFIGDDCSVIYKTCPGTPECYGHGSCNRLTGTCNCNIPYTSVSNCELRTCLDDCYSSAGQGSCNPTTGNCTCVTGWSGPNCNTRNVECATACANGGTCNLLTGTCICVSPWDPNTNCNTAPCVGNCNGQGTCNINNGSCTCNPTYLPPNCVARDIPCMNDCSGRGTCDRTTGQCNCTSPYNSLDGCATIQCPNDCSQRGTCNSATGVCTCDIGWTGTQCDTISSTCGTLVPGLICSGNGNCVGGQCNCTTVPSGQQPWLPAKPSFCGARQCVGTCFNGVCNTTTGVCDCDVLPDRFYTGTLCEKANVFCDDLDPANATRWCNALLGGGTCRGVDGVCVCNTGYSPASNCYSCTDGYIKELDTGKCVPLRTCAVTCAGRGDCNPYTGVCTCHPGYTGANCDAYDCPHGEYCDDAGNCYDEICSGVGICIPVDPNSEPPVTKCKCLSGYVGDNCSKRESSTGKTALAAALGCVAVVAVAGGGLYAARRHAIANYKKKMGTQKEMK